MSNAEAPPRARAQELLTPRQVAERLRFTTPRPVYRFIREGTLPASKLGGRWLIKPAAVEALLAGTRRQANPGGLRELERGR